jgi:cytidylate kinase
MGETAAADEPATARGDRSSVPRTIAVDGSAASGKSTVGRRLAEALGYAFLDTGIMYRAVTYAALQRGFDVNGPDHLTDLANSLAIDVQLARPGTDAGARILVDGEDVTDDLRGPEIDEAVSLVSRVAGVREALVRRQREIAASSSPGIVMAGRDIGTVVLPNADLKVYLDASLEERARRRYADFVETGHETSHEIVLQDIRRRDQIDSEREASPLRPAKDSVIIDTDGRTLDDVFGEVLELVKSR